MVVTEHTVYIYYTDSENSGGQMDEGEFEQFKDEISEQFNNFHMVGEVTHNHCKDFGTIKAIFVDRQQAFSFNKWCLDLLYRYSLIQMDEG